MANTYDIGDQVRLSVAFTNSAGVATDPTTVTITIRKPDQTTSTPTALTSATGTWYTDVTLDQTGNWYYRFAGTGALVAAEEGEFYVRVRRA